jgi:glutamate-ammonia-ligase adenylyltransferase
VFPIDARLRPHGREGELIVTLAQLESYFRDEAKPWEALTYMKLRHVAGDPILANQAITTVRAGIAGLATRAEFDGELSEVRTRLERSESPQNLKTGAGGSYDIDYLTGMLQAKHQLWFTGNLCERLQVLCERGLLPEPQAQALGESAHFLRTVEHLVRLVSARPRKWLPVADHPRRCVQKLLWSILGTNDSFDPEMRLAELMRKTRSIFLNYLSL